MFCGSVTCPPKTGPDVEFAFEWNAIQGEQVDGTKKVLSGTNHSTGQRKGLFTILTCPGKEKPLNSVRAKGLFD
jgi:hypothetical protein